MHVETRAAPARALELTPTLLRRLAYAAVFTLWGVVATGATVRLTGSGLGCEGWPGCSPGQPFPAKDYHSFVEFGNRLFSLLPITFSLATWLVAWRLGRASNSLLLAHRAPRWLVWTAFGVAAGTAAQAPLGLATVRLDLDPVAVMSHFLLAILVLGGAVVTAIEARRLEVGGGPPLVERRARLLSLGFVAAALALVVSGTFVTAAGPHAGDPDVAERLGRLDDAIWMHVRVSAVYGIALAALLWYLRAQRPRTRGVWRPAVLLLGLVVAQMVLGEVQWRNALPWWLVLAHVALAAAIWAASVAVVTLLWRPPVGVSRA